MKKLLAVMLSAAMVVSMTACGSKEEEPAAPAATPEATQAPEASEAPADTSAPADTAAPAEDVYKRQSISVCQKNLLFSKRQSAVC